MSLHADLLAQAHQLAVLDRGLPKQANLRRAVSSAYYGLFHFLLDASVRRLVRRAGGQAHRDLLARAFQHGEMKAVARSIAGGPVPRWWLGPPPSADLADVGRAFVHLQDARHAADYDRTRVFTRAEALDLVGHPL